MKSIFRRGALWYGQVWDGERGRWWRLQDMDGRDVAGIDGARAAVERIRAARHEGRLPAVAGRVSFGDWLAGYLASGAHLRKKERSRDSEREKLGFWLGSLGAKKLLADIAERDIYGHVNARLEGRIGGRKVSARTCNLDLTALRQCLKAAMAAGHLRALPPGMGNLRVQASAPRRLVTREELAALLAAAERLPRRGQLFADYLRFLAYTGAREKEALAVSWRAVDFERRAVLIGEAGLTKNSGHRWIEWSAALASLLPEMRTRSRGVSVWLFPSVRRAAAGDVAVKDYRPQLKAARAAAGLPWLGFHHLRHFFASESVMAGVDFRTLAEWMGHRDGGVLLGRVYAHLSGDHRRRAAAKLAF